MIEANEVFTAAMSLMDELDREGNADTSDTQEYRHRTPSILDTLTAEYRLLAGIRGSWPRIESIDDDLTGIDDAYALGVMQYGLAAKLLLDENPASASFFHQKYEEERAAFFAREPATCGEIEDLYGGIEYGRFSRW